MSKSAAVAVTRGITPASLVASTGALPAHLTLVEGASRGNENVGSNIQIPRVKLLQKMSNEVDRHHKHYMEGCEPGHFINSLTDHNYGNDVYVISLTFNIEFVVWRDMEKGGGYGGAFTTVEAAELCVAEQDVPADYKVVETHSHFILIKNPETGELERAPAIMDFANSKLRVSKAWNSQLAMKGGDRFAGLWKVSGVPTENKTGKAFMNCEVSFVGWAQEADYKAAEGLYEQYSN